MDWLAEVNNQKERFVEIFSFDEYMDIFDKNHRNELRTTSLYFKDMFDFYGRDEDGHFKLFKREHPEAPKVAGQFRSQEKIYNNIINFTEEGFNNKFLLLIGPNGSSKSSLIKKIMKTAEDYSKIPEGALYSFSWIFPIDNYIKGSLGLSSTKANKHLTSFAHLDDSEITAILASELKDHPLLLIPMKTRQKLIEKLFIDDQDRLLSVKNSYLYNGDLSKRNRLIFDALLKSYKGDFEMVIKHIRVERFNIDKRYSVAATTIEPQLHVDAKLQQITMDKRLASLPPSLQSINLFSINGEIVLSNRGILEYSDLLKRPLDTFKYLLMTMETKNINLGGILTELDILFLGSSNEVHFSAFKQHPDFNSFKGRFSFLKVPYLLDYKEELIIYQDQVRNLKDKSVFEPQSIEALSLWAVMTRMRHPQVKNFKDTKLGELSPKLTPIEKALFIAENKMPDFLSQEEQQILKLGKDEILEEFENEVMYEGKFGISPREIKQIIYELANDNKNITFIEIIEFLRELSEKKADYEFLTIAAQGDYHNPKKFLYLLEQYFLNQFDNEVRESLGLVDNRSYEDYIEKYVFHVTALLKKEKVKNKVTGKYEEPDMYLIKEFEQDIHLKENAENFRSHILGKLGAFALDNPGKKIVYTDVLEDISKQLRESFRNEQKKIIGSVGKNLVFYTRELKDKRDGKTMKSGLSKDGRVQIEKILEVLNSKFNYSQEGAINILLFLIKKRYESDKK
jgi:predicted Ser/Thr protein kinase